MRTLFVGLRQRQSQGIGAPPYYGYVEDLLGEVTRAFARHDVAVDGLAVRLVPGLFDETMPALLPEQVAFAHGDCDRYDPVLHVLRCIGGRMPAGGRIVLDDDNDYGGCAKAVHSFLAEFPDFTLAGTQPTGLLVRG